MSAADVPVMPINRLNNLMDEPHLSAIDFFERRQHPSEGEIRLPRQPVKFDKTPASIRLDPPALGEHNRELLLEVGLSEDEISALEADRSIVAQMPE